MRMRGGTGTRSRATVASGATRQEGPLARTGRARGAMRWRGWATADLGQAARQAGATADLGSGGWRAGIPEERRRPGGLSGGGRRTWSWERRDEVGAADLSRASVGGAYYGDGVGCRPCTEDLGFSLPFLFLHAPIFLCVCMFFRAFIKEPTQ